MLSEAEVLRRQELFSRTDRNIHFLQEVLGRGKRRAKPLTAPGGMDVFLCDGRFMQEKDSPHLREQLHVLVDSTSGSKCYSIYPGRLDVWSIRNGKLRRTNISPQQVEYHTIVAAVATTVRLCLPPAQEQLSLPVDNA